MYNEATRDNPLIQYLDGLFTKPQPIEQGAQPKPSLLDSAWGDVFSTNFREVGDKMLKIEPDTAKRAELQARQNSAIEASQELLAAVGVPAVLDAITDTTSKDNPGEPRIREIMNAVRAMLASKNGSFDPFVPAILRPFTRKGKELASPLSPDESELILRTCMFPGNSAPLTDTQRTVASRQSVSRKIYEINQNPPFELRMYQMGQSESGAEAYQLLSPKFEYAQDPESFLVFILLLALWEEHCRRVLPENGSYQLIGQVLSNGEAQVKLTPREHELFCLLLTTHGTSELANSHQPAISEGGLRVYIKSLKAKIFDVFGDEIITTTRGSGYFLPTATS